MVAMLEAIRGWDESRGVPFGAYARRLVMGRMIDGLGALTGCSRAQIRKARTEARVGDIVAAAAEAGEERSGGDAEPASAELVISGGLALLDMQECAELDLQEPGTGVRDEPFRRSPEEVTLTRQAREAVRDVVAELPEQERRVIVGHFFEGRSLSELAEEMGVNRSWTCRLQLRALRRLQALLRQRRARLVVRQAGSGEKDNAEGRNATAPSSVSPFCSLPV